MAKRLFITLLVFSFSLWATAQTKGNAKVYGYVQSVAGGARPTGDAMEGGGEVKTTPRSGTNYIIYLATPAQTRVYPVELWINGERYAATPKSITRTPVQLEEPAAMGPAKKTTLVPKTEQKVTQLTLLPAMDNKVSAKGKGLSRDNELVVVYKQSGKLYYSTLKTITRLEGAAMQ